MNKINLFATPFFQTNIKNSSSLNEQLKKVIFELESNGEKNKSPSQQIQTNVFESDFRFLDRKIQVISEIRGIIFRALGETVLSANRYKQSDMAEMNFDCSSWFHITRKNGYVNPHTHPNASWSMVYCVDGGDQVAEYPNSGSLIFYDPRVYCAMHMDKGIAKLERDYSFSGYPRFPKAGDLFFFPSYLLHSVAPYYGDKPRLTIAANFTFL